jgi:gluconolactonase
MTILMADMLTELPEALHHKGAPSEWAKMTRPGQQMHSFLEAV